MCDGQADRHRYNGGLADCQYMLIFIYFCFGKNVCGGLFFATKWWR